MKTKEYVFKRRHSLRLWLLTALLIVIPVFIQAQVTITYDNPLEKPGVNSSGTSESGLSYTFSALIPTSANNVTGKAYGGGGGGGSRGSASNYHAGGGGGGGYIEKNFGTVSGIASGQVGRGGPRGETSGLSGGPATDGASSYIAFGGITITADGGKAGTNNGYGTGGGTFVTGGTADYSRSGTNGGNYGSGNGGAGGNSGGYPDYGGGAGASYPTEPSQGYNGYNPGGGGSGGQASVFAANPGGHGSGGRVVLSYNISALTITSSTNRCQGSTITLTASYGEQGTSVALQWYKDGTLISGATQKTYTINNAQPADNGNYTVRATYNITYTNATSVTGSSLPTGLSLSGNTLSGTVTSSLVTIAVNPVPVISDKAVVICSGETFSVTPESPDVIPSNTTYSWPIPASIGVTGATAGTNTNSISSGTLTNTTSIVQTVTYVVTPKAGNGCEGTPFNVVVTINPKPVISNKTTTACSGVAFSLTPASPDVVPSGTTYNWSIPTVAGITAGQNDPTSGTSITGTLINSTDAPINVTYLVTPTAGNGCVGATFNVTVTVNPKPVISEKRITACSGDLFSIVPTNTAPDVVPTGTTYSWVISPSLPAGITADQVSDTDKSSISGILTLSNTITTPQTVTYVVTPKTQASDGGCTGDPFSVVVTVNPKRVISDQTVAVCSGESVDITNPGGITNATYTWELTSISGGTLDNPLMKGSGNSINVGTLINTSTSDAFVRYKVTPTSTQDCVGTFDLIVTVRHIPQIEAPSTTICSGQKMQLSPIPSGGSSYSSSDNSIAFIDANGMLYTDVDIVDGVPIERESHSTNEGKGGVVTITYTTANGCVATQNITVTPRTKTPYLRRNFDGTCPEPNSSSVSWDWLVVNNGRQDVTLPQIKWYTGEACTPTQYIRSGGDALPADGSMNDFSPSVPFRSKVYWATITPTDSCESRPVRVEINIRDLPEQFQITDLIGYVQPPGTPAIDLSDFLDLNLDPTQSVEWYATQDDANKIGEPSALIPTQSVDITYWLIKVDNIDPDDPCRSLPTPFRVRLVPMPTIAITPDKPLVCPGEQVTVTVTINNGIAPYHFKVKDMNSGDIIDESQMTTQANGAYTFTANPLSTDTYRVIELSDATTPLVTDPRLELHTPIMGYFAETVLSVIVTEISGISPNAGPTAGGTYTTDPNDPINPDGEVTITGSGFLPFGSSTPWVSLVTFGGVAATKVKVVNDNTITCIPPAHLSGYVTVAVTTGCTTTTMTDGYRYEPINITGVQPYYAPVTGGTTIIIKGTGLLASEDNKDLVTVTLAGVPATIVSVSNTEIQCIAGPSNYSLLGEIVINNGSETREFPKSFTYYPVNFIENGNWSEPHRWETQTADHILPYPGADVQIKANCVQDINVDMDSITIYPSKAYTLNNGIELKANVFTLKDNASFLDYNTNSANMQVVQQNVEHTLTKGRNWYVSSPVQSGTIPTISSALGNARVEYYDETSHTWKAGTNPFVTGLGYTAYSADADISVKFSGTYTNGNQTTSFNLTRQNDGHPKRGFNLVGNPFPSYWNWTSTAAQQANVYSTIWYRTNVEGVYEFWSYNASGDVAVAPSWKDATPTGSYSLAYIPPMQAFWVRIIDGQSTGTLTFTDNLRSHADHNSNMLKSTETINTETRPLLRLAVSNGISTDEAVIYADTEAKKDFDTYDSDKWFVNQGVEIFTLPASSTRELVINGLPEIVAGTEIPLGFQADEGGSFSFYTKEILNLDTLNVFLSDKWRNMEFDLRTGDYNFTSSSVSVTDRFSIVFRRATGVSGLSDTKTGDDNLLVYSDRNGQMIVVLHLRNPQESNANLSIFDITGCKLAEQSVVVDERTILKNTFPEGVYVLRAGKCTAKMIVKGR